MNDKAQKLYDALVSSGYKLPDYETFSTGLQDRNKAEKLYGTLSESGYKLPDFETFYSPFSQQQITQPIQQEVAVEEPPAPSFQPTMAPSSLASIQQDTGTEDTESLRDKAVSLFQRGERQSKVARELSRVGIDVDSIADYLSIFNRGAYSAPSNILETASVLSSELENKVTGKNVSATDTWMYKIGQEWRDFLGDITPVDQETQESFSGQVTKALGEMVPIVLSGSISGAGKAGAVELTKQMARAGTSATPYITAGKEIISRFNTPAGLTGGAQIAAASYTQALEEGATEEQARDFAIENFFVGSAMESLPVQAMFKRLARIEPNARILEIIKNGAVGASEEAITEMYQETYANMSANRVYNANKEMLEGVGEAGAVGGAVGFIMNAMLSALTGRRIKAKTPEERKVIDKATEETEDKIKAVEGNNKKIEDGVKNLEEVKTTTLNDGKEDYSFVQGEGEVWEYTQEGMDAQEAESKAKALQTKYPNLSFEIVDNTDTDELAQANFTIRATPDKKLETKESDLAKKAQEAAKKEPVTEKPVAEEPVAEEKTSPSIPISEIEGVDVVYQGREGVLKKEGQQWVVESENEIVELPDAKDDSLASDFGLEYSAPKYEPKSSVERPLSVTENKAVVGDTEYTINLNPLGNVASLTYTDKDGKKKTTRDENLIVAVEVERNRLEPPKRDTFLEEVENDETNDASNLDAVNNLLNLNMTERVERVLDEGIETADDQDLLQTRLWAEDTIDRLENYKKENGLEENEFIENLINNLYGILDQTESRIPKEETGKPVDIRQPSEAVTVEDGTEKPGQRDIRKDDTKKGTRPKKIAVKQTIEPKLKEVYKKKRPFFSDIKKEMEYPSNAKVSTVAKDYDKAMAVPKNQRTEKQQKLIDLVDEKIKTPYKKPPSQKGKTPLDQREIRGKEKQAVETESKSVMDLVQKWFISGGRLSEDGLQEIFGKRGQGGFKKSIIKERNARMSYIRTPEKGGKGIQAIVEEITNTLTGQFEGTDQMVIRNAVEDTIKDHNSIAQMANSILERSGQKEGRQLRTIEDRAGLHVNDAIADMFTEEEWAEMSYEEKAYSINDYYGIPQNQDNAWTPEMVKANEELEINPNPEEIQEAVIDIDAMSDEEYQKLMDEVNEQAFMEQEIEESVVDEEVVQEIEEGQTETEEFKEWFGDSKVVDPEGKPLVVYHGTDAEFNEFSKGKMREGRIGKGFYFTTSREEALNYGKNIKEAYLKIDKLFNGRTMKTTGDGKNFGAEYTISDGGGRVFMVDDVSQIRLVEDAKPINKSEQKAIADRIRDKKINGALSSIDFGLTPAIYNSALDFLANQVEKGTKLGNAIAKTIKYIDGLMDGKKWDKGKFAKYANDTYRVTLPNGQEVDAVRDDTKKTAEVINGWYQPIEQSILNSKQDKLPAKTWAERLRSKEDEDLWTGLRGFLEGKGDESVSKQELLDFIKGNRVEISEVIKEFDTEIKFPGEDRLREIVGILNERGYDIELDEADEFRVRGVDDGTTYLDLDGYTREQLENDGYTVKETYEEDVKLLEEAEKLSSNISFSTNQIPDERSPYMDYVLPGDKTNYKEVLVTLPSKRFNQERYDYLKQKIKKEDATESDIDEFQDLTKIKLGRETGKKFKSTHFDTPNILTHLRMNTRISSDGKKVLFLEEIQSDWGQKGKKEGFSGKKATESDVRKVMEDAFGKAGLEQLDMMPSMTGLIQEIINNEPEAADLENDGGWSPKQVNKLNESIKKFKVGGVPTAPFVTSTPSWVKLALKTAIKEAVAQDVDVIAWTTGEQQNERYNLSNQVDEIRVVNNGDETFGIYGVKDSKIIVTDESVPKNKLADVIGKDLASKIEKDNIPDQEGRVYEGKDLEVGGKGMKDFYGRIVPNVAKATVKELTGKDVEVSEVRIPSEEETSFNPLSKKLYGKHGFKAETTPQQSIPITPELKASVQAGMPLFGVATPQEVIKKQEQIVKDKFKEVKENFKKGGFDNMGIAFDFKKAAQADIDFYNSLVDLVREYVRLKGMQAADVYSRIEKNLNTTLNPEDRKFLKAIIDDVRKEIPKVNVMSENKGMTKDEQVKQGLEEILEAKRREAKNKLNQERQKAKERIAKEKEKGKAKLDEFKRIKNTMIDFLKMDLGDLPASAFTKGEFQKVLTQINNANTDYSLNKAIESAYGVFADAASRQRVAKAGQKIKTAKANLKAGKLGVIEPNSLFDKLLRINPKIIPAKIFQQYDAILNNIGQRQKVLSLAEKSQLYQEISKVIDAVDEQNSRVMELKDLYDNYPDKEKEYSKTLLKMFKEDVITEEEYELMKLYKKDIAEQQEEELTEKNIEQAIEDTMDSVKNISVPPADYSILERGVIRLFKSITDSDLRGLTYQDILAVQKIVSNIESGFIPHISERIRQKIEGNRSASKLMPVLSSYKGSWMNFISSFKAGIKNLRNPEKTSTLREKIRRNPLSYIDQILENFRTTDVYDNIFRKLAIGHANYENDVNTYMENVRQAILKLPKGSKQQFESRAKLMMLAIQTEFESNPDQKGTNTAKAYLDATINAKNSVYSKNSRDKLQDIFNKYADSNGELDSKKLYDGLSDAEKNAFDSINKLNREMLRPKAMDTSTLIRGNRVPIYENYIHLPRYIKGKQTEADVKNLQYGVQQTSLKAGNLTERTGKAHPILFDFFANSTDGAKATLLDYNLTPASREVNNTISNLYNLAQNDKDIETVRAIDEVYNEVMENVYGIQMSSTSLGESAMNEIVKKGYQATLSGIGRSSSEFVSNAVFAAIYKGVETNKGLGIIGKHDHVALSRVVKNINSAQSNRLYSIAGMDNKHIDFSKMNVKEIAKVTGYDEGVLKRLFDAIKDNPAYEFVDQIQSFMVSKPDQLIGRPMFFGAFDQQFEAITGKKPDYNKIAENDQDYMEKNNEAIADATKYADDVMVEAVASSNPFDGIVRNQVNPTKNAVYAWFKTFNGYMTRFPTYEYNSAVRGVHSLFNNGMLSKQDSLLLLAALNARLLTYSLLTGTLVGMAYKLIMKTLFNYEPPEEKTDDTVGNVLAKESLSALAMLAINRNLGNVGKIPINIALEMANMEYGEGITYSGKYDSFDNSIVYPIVPLDVERGQKPLAQSLVENTAGPLSPQVKTFFRTLTAADRLITGTKEVTKDKYRHELMTRTPFEIAGNLGYIPAYKDLRSMMLKMMYENESKAKKATKGNNDIDWSTFPKK